MNSGPAIYPDIEEQKAFYEATQNTGRSLFPRLEINEVFQLYGVPESQLLEILQFLSINPELIQTLMEAVPHLDRIFGDARRYLELDQDPDGEFEELFCVILVDAQPEQALRMLRRLDQTWFSKAAKDIHNRLNFTVDTADDEPV